MFTIDKPNPLKIKPHKMYADSTKGMEGVREPLHKTGNFLYMLVGPPGSSKTTMIMHLLMSKDCFKRRFDQVHFYSPSLSTMDVPLPPERLHRGDLDVDEVEKTMKAIPQGERGVRLSNHSSSLVSFTILFIITVRSDINRPGVFRTNRSKPDRLFESGEGNVEQEWNMSKILEDEAHSGVAEPDSQSFTGIATGH